jgi:hypothetical protein
MPTTLRHIKPSATTCAQTARFELPIGPGQLLLSKSSGWLARLLEHWQTGVIFNVRER